MRPRIVMNAAVSVDGKISTTTRDFHGFGGKEDLDEMDELRASADAVMIGAGTLRAEDPQLTVTSADRIRKRTGSGRLAQPAAIVVSGTLRFPTTNSRFFAADCRKLVCTAEEGPADRLNALSGLADLLLVPADGAGAVDLPVAMETLSAMGVETLLLEGGGTLNFAMLAADLVDEIFLTVCPMVIGGSRAPTAFDGHGFDRSMIRQLKLAGVREGAEGRLFLRYTA